jgi:hypothetical protein
MATVPTPRSRRRRAAVCADSRSRTSTSLLGNLLIVIDESTVQMLKVVQLAQQAGFTVAEIQTLLNGFAPDTPPAARWQPLAQQKIAELDGLVVRAQQMKRILENGLNCGCLRLEECAIELERGCCVE